MIIAITKRGKVHIEAKKPLQDRYCISRDSDGITLAIADGHGGEPYVRSGFGARIACHVAAKNMALCHQETAESLATKIKTDFDSLVTKHLEKRPLSDEALALLEENPPLYAYGTTLLAVRIDSMGMVMLQIGDGSIHAARGNGRFFPQLAEDENCVGGYTSSLVQEDCVSKIRIQRFSEQPACLIMHSDGYEIASQYPWDILEKMSPAYSIENLLEDTENGDTRGDDQTMIVFLNEPAYYPEYFPKGIAAEKALYEKKKQKEHIKKEIASLWSFLTMALEKYKTLPEPDREAFKERSITPRYKRYVELTKLLGAE